MKYSRLRIGPSAFALLALLAGCTSGGPDRLALTPVAFKSLPGWKAERTLDALPALATNCAKLMQLPPDTALGGEGEAARLGGAAGQWADLCASVKRFRPKSELAAKNFFERHLAAYRVTDNYALDARYTGYFEPQLEGDRQKSDACAVPLYGRPSDLVEFTRAGTGGAMSRLIGRVERKRLVPYFDRAAIDNAALDGRGLELLWLKDPVDLFFLQIQGSGRVHLPDGSIVRIGYAGQNGRPFIDISRILVEQGKLDPGARSMQAIRDWLHVHPTDAQSAMETNPSYVFFREIPSLRPDDGPIGAFGLPLLPGRSVAVDRAFLPLGAPMWIDTKDSTDGSKLQRLVLAMDTGGMIRGPARADIFFGWGEDAAKHAGGMSAKGGAYVLLPRDDQLMVAAKP